MRWKMRYNLLGSKRARVLEPIHLFQEVPVCGRKAFLLAWALDFGCFRYLNIGMQFSRRKHQGARKGSSSGLRLCQRKHQNGGGPVNSKGMAEAVAFRRIACRTILCRAILCRTDPGWRRYISHGRITAAGTDARGYGPG